MNKIDIISLFFIFPSNFVLPMSKNDKEQIVNAMAQTAGINIVNNNKNGCLIGPDYKYVEKTERIEELLETKKELEIQLQATNTELKKLIIAEHKKPKIKEPNTTSFYESLFSFSTSTVKDNMLKFYYDFKRIIIMEDDKELVLP